MIFGKRLFDALGELVKVSHNSNGEFEGLASGLEDVNWYVLEAEDRSHLHAKPSKKSFLMLILTYEKDNILAGMWKADGEVQYDEASGDNIEEAVTYLATSFAHYARNIDPPVDKNGWVAFDDAIPPNVGQRVLTWPEQDVCYHVKKGIIRKEARDPNKNDVPPKEDQTHWMFIVDPPETDVII